MLHLYFFISSDRRDGINRLTVMTSSRLRAYAIAQMYFLEHNAYGVPMMLSV